MHTRLHPLDLQYNALATTPGTSTRFAAWARRAEQARASMPGLLDLPYGPDSRQRLDLFPAESASRPLLVFLHGGYWRGSDKSLHSFIAPAFVAQGASVALMNYGLCPAVSLRDICRQVDAGLDYLQARLPSPGRIVLAGHSAGAHLAAMALLDRARKLSSARIERVLCVSGLFDLSPLREAPFIRDDLNLNAEDVHNLSPVQFSPPPGATVMAAVGARESPAFHQQTARLKAAWGPDVVVSVDTVEERDHFSILEDLADEQGLLHARACNLLFD